MAPVGPAQAKPAPQRKPHRQGQAAQRCDSALPTSLAVMSTIWIMRS